MSRKRKHILSIGGFDPSAGAGVLSDIKTFEQHGLLGMAVNTANTVQTEDKFVSVNWLDESLILEQLDLLLDQYVFSHVKIGLVPSLNFISTIVDRFKGRKTCFIWDPILKASAGFDMNHDIKQVETILNQVDFITPNWDEIQLISGNKNSLEAAEQLNAFCSIYLKGGHNSEDLGRDFVFHNRKRFNLKPMGSKVSEKHGSGCVLSSALASNLALGFPLQKACLKAKNYTTRVLESNESLLGYHKR